MVELIAEIVGILLAGGIGSFATWKYRGLSKSLKSLEETVQGSNKAIAEVMNNHADGLKELAAHMKVHKEEIIKLQGVRDDYGERLSYVEGTTPNAHQHQTFKYESEFEESGVTKKVLRCVGCEVALVLVL